MSTPYDPELDPARETHRHDTGADSGAGRTGHDVGGGQHVRPGHTEAEGEYEDRDVPATGTAGPEAVGSYTDVDVTPGEQEHARDEGEYTDTDVVPEERRVPGEGEYTDVDPEEASHHRRTEGRNDIHG